MWVNKIHSLEKDLALPAELVLLVRVHVAQLNTCTFCVDIKQAIGMQPFGNEEKIFQLTHYAASAHFTPSEKAALEFAHALTVHKKIPEEVFARS